MAKDVFLQNNIPTKDFSEAVRKLLDQPRFQVLSYPPYGARERDPVKRWSSVSQNLGDNTQTIWGQVSVRFVSRECRQVSAAVTWSWTRKIMHKILWQKKRNFLQNIWMLMGCLSAVLSFGICNGNHGCQIARKSPFVQSKIISVSWSAR